MSGKSGRFGDARSKLQHLVDLVNFDKNRRFAELQKRLQVKIKEAIDESYRVAKAKLKADRKELIAASKERFAREQQVVEKLQEANGFLQLFQMDALEIDAADIMEECELLEREIAKIIGKTKTTKNWFEEARRIAKRVPQIGKGEFIANTVALGRIDWQVDELDIGRDDQSSEDDFEQTGEDDFEKRKSVIRESKQENGDSLFEVVSGVADLNPYRCRSPPPAGTSVAGTSGAAILESSNNGTSQTENAKRMRPYVDYRFHDDRAEDNFELEQKETSSENKDENKDELSAFSERIAKMKPLKNIFASSVRDIQKEASRKPATVAATVAATTTQISEESKFFSSKSAKTISPISTRDSFKSARAERTVTVSRRVTVTGRAREESPAHHCATRIDISDIRSAETKTVVNDEFDKPMGIGGGRAKVFIPNSGAKGSGGEVFVYNLDGNYIATLRPPGSGFNVATSIVEINKDNSKFYLVKDNFKVYVFEEKEFEAAALKAKVDFKYAFSLDKLGKMPVGLCYIDGYLFIANGDCFISKLSLAGDLIETVELNWRQSGQLATRPRIRYANTFADDIFLPCMANFKVIQSSKEGQIKRVFGQGVGSSVSQMRQPAGLTFDAVGNFIIADSKNHRLLIFDEKTGKSRTLHYPKKFSRPSDVHLHDDGTLCVSSLDGNVYLMTVQGAQLKK